MNLSILWVSDFCISGNHYLTLLESSLYSFCWEFPRLASFSCSGVIRPGLINIFSSYISTRCTISGDYTTLVPEMSLSTVWQHLYPVHLRSNEIIFSSPPHCAFNENLCRIKNEWGTTVHPNDKHPNGKAVKPCYVYRTVSQLLDVCSSFVVISSHGTF